MNFIILKIVVAIQSAINTVNTTVNTMLSNLNYMSSQVNVYVPDISEKLDYIGTLSDANGTATTGTVSGKLNTLISNAGMIADEGVYAKPKISLTLAKIGETVAQTGYADSICVANDILYYSVVSSKKVVAFDNKVKVNYYYE